MSLKVSEFDFIIVGAGFFGATVAQKLADRKKKILVIDKRNHVSGNAYSYKSPGGSIDIHKYGSHIFHTNVTQIWDYISNFGTFNNYIHKVTTLSQGERLPIPINLETLRLVLGEERATEMVQKIEKDNSVSKKRNSDNLQDWAISKIGLELYTRLIAGYTEKQWGMPPSKLPSSIISRLPIRTNYDDRYFSDIHQGIPESGYEKLTLNQLADTNIKVELELDYFDLREYVNASQTVIYTGPIDRYFDFQKGALGWRTLDFEIDILHMPSFQNCAVQNFADISTPYTRVHEFKYLHPERPFDDRETVISREYSRASTLDDDPYYPINTIQDREILSEYRTLMKFEKNVFFGGRLGSYQYLDMHMAIGQAFELSNTLLTREGLI